MHVPITSNQRLAMTQSVTTPRCFLGPGCPTHLRPGHYTVKSVEYGFECLRCGMKGDISSIKAQKCSNPKGEVVYPEEEKETTKYPFKSEKQAGASEKELREELVALQAIEQEMALLEELHQEQELLEALEYEELMIDVKQVSGADDGVVKEIEECENFYWKRHNDNMMEKLIKMQFPERIASWAVEVSKGVWETALDKAYCKIQEEEHEEMLRAEKEEERVKRTKVADAAEVPQHRPALSPCRSTSVATMPPPALPPKKPVLSETKGTKAAID